MRIDAHQHYWKLGRGDYAWITPNMLELNRDYLPADLASHLQKHKLDGTIVVQAAATLAETDYMLSLASEEDSILGVVGWLDLDEPSYLEHFARFQHHPKFVGFRVMIQEMPDARAILKPHYIEALTFFSEQDIPVDLLVTSHQLDAVVQLIKQVPNLRCVIDHIAKPDIAKQKLEPWKSQMSEIAAYPKVYCKLSGMVTEAEHAHWKRSDFTTYIHHILHVFGPNRVMFGSDWPVCLLAADYDQVVDILVHSLPSDYTQQEVDLLFGLNAKQFYRL